MKRKCLAIGISTISVILLILTSLSNVVGYQSVKSTVVNDSPLFRTRTQRATNQEQNIITSQYLGMGKGNQWQFPMRDNRTLLIQKFIDRIRTMDDETFNRFVNFAVNQINHKNNLKTVNIEEFTRQLHQLRENTQNIVVYKDNLDDNITYRFNFVPSMCWFPGCLVIDVILLIIALIYLNLGPSFITLPCLLLF